MVWEPPIYKKTSVFGSQQALLLQMGTTHLCDQRAVLLHPDVWCGSLDLRHEIAAANVVFGGHAAVLTVAATNPFLKGISLAM